MKASAPGKLMLFGEYAVLEGAPALVMAVDRRARVQLRPAVGELGSFESDQIAAQPVTFTAGDDGPHWHCDAAMASRLALARHLLSMGERDQALNVQVDTAAFVEGTNKLGLGSSAAVTVAWLAAALATDDPQVVQERALAVHRAFQQGRGSGADVAASAHGGLLEYRAGPRHSTRRLVWPAGLRWAAVWTGRSADTRSFLDRLAVWQERQPSRYADRLDRLAALATAAADGFGRGDVASILDLAREYVQALEQLGTAAEIPIVCERHRPLVALAAAHEVVYKPSGAGGGDLGLVLARSREQILAFCDEAARHSAVMLELAMSETGVRVEADP